MTRRLQFLRWKALAGLLVLGLAATGSGSSRAGGVNAVAPYTVSRACTWDTARVSACDLVIGYFRAINTGRYREACGMLGFRLRFETGGPDCPRVLAYAGHQRFGIVGARHVAEGIGVVVALDLPELDHVRVLHWLAVVGREHGDLRLLETRLV